METTTKIDSKYQVAIYDTYLKTNKNIFVSAGPGSGKSYTILQMVKKTPFYKKVIQTAFNKSIAEELKTKVPSNIEVSTIHSLGFKILRKNVYGRFQLKEIKTFILAKKVIEDPFKGKKNGHKQYSIYLFTIAKLYDLYRLNLADKTPEALQLLADEYSVETPISVEVNIFNDTIKVIDYIQDYNNSGSSKEWMIDFTDMLWMPYTQVDKNYFPKYDVVFIDECQDMPALQRELILNTVSKKGRFIAVGDEKQAIYSFMGANLGSFEKLKAIPNTEVLLLSVSYRCPSSVVDFANSIFPGLEPFEGNPEGVIREGSFKDIQEGDMLLCRNNLPLIETFLELLNLNKKSYIMGRDFGKSLTDLINSVDSEEGLYELLEKKIERLTKRNIENPFNHKSYVALKEKVDIIKLLMDKKDYTLGEVSNLFNTLFKDKPNGNDSVVLSTIHKSKGLENERVIWLYPQLIPSQYAKTELELYQERCLKYVCITRAIKELIIINQV